MDIEKRVGVGVAIILMKEKEREVLLGKRKGNHSRGTWGFPGGKLNYFEVARQGGLRELSEETGLTDLDVELIDKRHCALTEDLFSDGLHFVTLYLRAKYISGNPRVMEPKNCEEWGWYSWKKLPNNLFMPVRNLVKQNYDPFKDLK